MDNSLIAQSLARPFLELAQQDAYDACQQIGEPSPCGCPIGLAGQPEPGPESHVRSLRMVLGRLLSLQDQPTSGV